MNDVRLHVPYIFGNKQNSEIRRTQREIRGKTEGRERPVVGQEKQERGKTKAR